VGGYFGAQLARSGEDIAEGKPSEIDYWNGSVVRQGRAVNVSTPTNQFIYDSLRPQELRARGDVVFPQ
jgi:2-dehydropantoate 2-reductase